MMNKDNGGPAFVFPGFEFFDSRANDGVGERVVYEPHNGMTLRDYFAAKAMAGFLASETDAPTFGQLAKFAYQCADAMLAERAK